MTQPTDRPDINHLTSDMLDQLYAERDRYRTAWTSARARTQAHQEGTLRHVADRDSWKSWTKKAESQLAALKRAHVALAEQAAKDQATLTAVRKLHDRWECDANVCAVCVDGYGNPVSYPCPTTRLLDQYGQTPS